jgi:starvation-inducible DNA-binding protein
MAPTVSQAHLPPLGARQREEVGGELQASLLELIDLSLLGKQLHWNVVGPYFRSLHLQLDELVDAWRELGDTVAERSVALGHAPDGQAGTVAAGSGIDKLDRGPIEDHVVVRELTERLAQVVENQRARMDRLGELDLAAQDVLIEVVRALEEQLWMIRVQLPQTGA